MNNSEITSYDGMPETAHPTGDYNEFVDRMESDLETRRRGDLPEFEAVSVAAEYFNELRQSEGEFENANATEPGYDEQTIMKQLSLDAANLISHDWLCGYYEHHKTASESRNHRDESRAEAMLAGKSLQEHLTDYLELFENERDDLLYSTLEIVMHDAQRLVTGNNQINGRETKENRKILSGLIAEHQVLACLREDGWPMARYGSVKDDRYFRTDIIVPIGPWQKRETLPLQVKAELTAEWLTIDRSLHHPVPVVRVPMSGKHLTFSLPDSFRRQLVQYVKNYEQSVLS